jgi:putative transposase
MKIHIRGDERILGDSDFVEKVLSQASGKMERRYRLGAEGWTLTKIIERVSDVREHVGFRCQVSGFRSGDS